MRTRKILPVLACLALPFALNSATAGELLDTKAFLKEVVASSPGQEIIMPLIVETDNNADDYPDRMTMKFKVHPAGSTTKLFSTPQKKFTPPANPCSQPNFVDWDWDTEFFGEDNTHTGMGLLFFVECGDDADGQFKEAVGSFVYVADTTQAGSGWAKSWSLDLVSVDFVDWDNDQQEEVKVVMAIENDSEEKLRVIFLDKLTGAIESDKKYLINQSWE